MGVIEALFGIALMSLVFWALFGVFKLSIEIVLTSKAKIGALALANERIEFIRSLSYDDVGTLGGIPAGNIVQNESITLNQTRYNRRTYIQYADDSHDGSGVNDENGITADYKIAKVELTWDIRGRAHSYSLVTNVVPRGMESLAGGGTIFVTVLDAFGSPLSGADVRIVNSTTAPAIDVTTFSNAEGLVMLPGAPAASDYQVTVTKVGYSTAQTYDPTVANPNPNPAHLSVAEAQTTSATFSIDELSSLAVYTYEPIQTEVFTDEFLDASKLSSVASTTVTGAVELASSGGVREPEGSATSVTIASADLYQWGEFSWEDALPLATSIRYRVLYESGPGVFEAIPDAALPGNAVGFSTSPLDLSGVSTTTYASLRFRADLTTADNTVTPSVNSWNFVYEVGPIPVPNIAFALQGTKVIGSDAAALPIYKYSQNHNTGALGRVTLMDLEWDTYNISVDSSVVGWDVAAACPFQPFALAPGTAGTVFLYLVPNTAHTLLVNVVDAAGMAIPGASVRLYRGVAYDETQDSSSCGQTMFGALTSAIDYTLEVTKVGYQVGVVSNVAVSGATKVTVVLTP